SGGVADMQTASGAADQTPDAPSRTKFTEALVARYTRKMPEGSDLATLLPTKVGPFSRPSNAAQGDIATDPVSATYSGDADVVTVTLDACWDADEARDKQQRRQSKLENSKSAQDHSWSVGVNSQGVVFIWTRAHYCYEIVSPRGVPALTRFLADFPY
ncbi:MAG: hypothetical protein WCL29_06020, partial [Pseudomonadota bacterium]